MPKYDIELVRAAAAGRWTELLTTIGKIDQSILNRDHHPCPKCGGNDRFRALDDFEETGAVICNQCHNRKNGDGFGALQWLLGQDFGKVLHVVATHVSVKPEGKNKKVDPAKDLEFLPWSQILVAMWAKKKGGITVEGVKRSGAKLARYQGEFTVIAVPVWGPQLNKADPIGWALYNTSGGDLPKKRKDGSMEWVKVKTTYGSDHGIMGDVELWNSNNNTNSTNSAQNAELEYLETTDHYQPASGAIDAVMWWKTEGPSDLLALLSLRGSERFRCLTNSNGASEKPQNWIVDLVAGGIVQVVHDADLPGQQGATWVGEMRRPGWCPRLAERAASVVNVKLPYPIADTKGKDLRDWIIEGGTIEQLTTLAEVGEKFGQKEAAEAKVLSIEESDDDPHRLARVNLARYSEQYNRKLIFWRDEWWRWKEGRYVAIPKSELRAKVNYAIHQEFVRCWRTGDKDNPVKQVKTNLVNNVIAAMESICTLPGSVPMPCWLPDRSRPHYVSMANGLLDLDAVFNGKSYEECLKSHSAEWFSPFKLDYAFNPDAQCPRWMEYLDYAMEGDRDRIAILQEWAGYLLTPRNDHQKFLVLEGEGKNGKTVYFAAMSAMLGEENVSHVSIENFERPFDIGTTIGKAANISGDAGEIDSVAEGVLKQFTGGEVMTFDRKNREPISIRPTAKLMAAWNSRPRIKDRSQGLWRRMLLIPFNRQVEAHKRVRGMDESQWWIDQGEAAGILRWAIMGLHRLNVQGEFSQSEICSNAMSDYRRESNPASEFLQEHLEESSFDSVPCGRVYEMYEYWCKKTGHKPLGASQFGKEISRKFPDSKRMRARNGISLYWEYRFLKFSCEEIFGRFVNENF